MYGITLKLSKSKYKIRYNFMGSSLVFNSFQEWANAIARSQSSVRLSVCKLLRKSLLLAGKWPDRHQTCTRWSPGKPASRVFSRSRSKVTWYAYFFAFFGMSYSVIDGLVWSYIFQFSFSWYYILMFSTSDVTYETGAIMRVTLLQSLFGVWTMSQSMSRSINKSIVHFSILA